MPQFQICSLFFFFCDRYWRVLSICKVMFFLVLGIFFFLISFLPLFSLLGTTIIWILFIFSGTASSSLNWRNLLLKSKSRVLYLPQHFLICWGKKHSLHKEGGRLVGGRGWKYRLELASFYSPDSLLLPKWVQTWQHRGPGPTPDKLVSTLSSAADTGWASASHINSLDLRLLSVKRNVNNICTA